MLRPALEIATIVTIEPLAAPSSVGPDTPVVLRGPGWHLVEGERNGWHIHLFPTIAHPAASLADLRRRVDQLVDVVGPHPLTLDLRGLSPLGPTTRELLARLLRSWEQRCLPFVVHVGADAIQAVRVHSLILHNAPRRGRCATDLETTRRESNPLDLHGTSSRVSYGALRAS